MATWITHLRIAENILKEINEIETLPFMLGNIGPDSGVPNEDWSNFNPPKKITHWIDDTNKINPTNFYNKYLNNDDIRNNKEYYSFYLGYYIHLLTDAEWSKFHNQKKQENPTYEIKIKEDPNFIWTVKKDWYGLDYLYLEKNPDCIFFTRFKKVAEVPDYLDYFPKKAFKKQVKYITDFYLGENNETKENFVYLTEEEMDKFVIEISQLLISHISENEL